MFNIKKQELEDVGYNNNETEQTSLTFFLVRIRKEKTHAVIFLIYYSVFAKNIMEDTKMKG